MTPEMATEWIWVVVRAVFIIGTALAVIKRALR